jgi:hypothetical protein
MWFFKVLHWFSSPVNKLVAFGSLVLAFVVSLYAKGRADANAKRELKELKERQRVRTEADKARRDSNAKSDAGGLLDNDGFKRD